MKSPWTPRSLAAMSLDCSCAFSASSYVFLRFWPGGWLHFWALLQSIFLDIVSYKSSTDLYFSRSTHHEKDRSISSSTPWIQDMWHLIYSNLGSLLEFRIWHLSEMISRYWGHSSRSQRMINFCPSSCILPVSSSTSLVDFSRSYLIPSPLLLIFLCDPKIYSISPWRTYTTAFWC